MDTGQGRSSKRTGDLKKKGIWKPVDVAANRDVDHCMSSSSYCLFPDTGPNKSGLLGIFSLDQPQPQLKLPRLEDTPSCEDLTPYHRKVPIEVQAPTFSAMYLPGSNAKAAAELNLQVKMSYPESSAPVASGGSGSQFPETFEQGYNITLMNEYGAGGLSEHQPSSFSSFAPSVVDMDELAHLITVQKAYCCAVLDLDQRTPLKLHRQSTHALTNQYAHNVLMPYSGEHPANAVTLEAHRISGPSEAQHYGSIPINVHSSGSGPNNTSHDIQLLEMQMRSPMKLIHIKGHVAGFCANAPGSRFVQQALETATPKEIIMVYEEIMPYVRRLATDVFGNHAVQKLLDYGSRFYKRKVIGCMIGHVLALSLHMYGCRAVQKAFEVADMDQKIQMARELGRKLMKCVRDPYANHVIQKCMDSVPPQHIQFMYKSFRGKAKVLSLHVYGCRVMQKVLSCCGNPEIYDNLVKDIIESVTRLAADPMGNYVVQHVLEHGGPFERSAIVQKISGRIMSMSYHKLASNVVEKCLTFGSYNDRRLITEEILTAGGFGDQHFDHLTDMMGNLYANFVIQTMVLTAEERHLALLVEVARRNVGTLVRCAQGRQVLATMERVLSKRVGRLVILGQPSRPV